MKRQSTLIFGMICLMGVMFVSFVDAEMNLSDSLANQRYQNIVKEFNKTDWVPVIVEVYSPEEVDNLISSLSEIDFKNVKKETSTIFSVKVTKAGLDKLVNDSNVKTINLEESSNLVDNQPVSGSELKFNWLYLLIGIILILIIFWIIWRIKKKK